MATKKIKVEVGDVFRVPISEGRSGFGQVLAKYEKQMLFMALFLLEKKNDQIIPLLAIVDSPLLFLANSMDAKLWHGDWPIIGNVSPDCHKIPLPKYKVRIGGVLYVESYDGMRKRPATESEDRALSFRKCFYPQILEDALKDYFGALESSQFNPSELERLRKEFVSMKPDIALNSAKVAI